MLEGDLRLRGEGSRRCLVSPTGDGDYTEEQLREYGEGLDRRPDYRSVGGLDPPGRLPNQFDQERAVSDRAQREEANDENLSKAKKLTAGRERIRRWRERKRTQSRAVEQRDRVPSDKEDAA